MSVSRRDFLKTSLSGLAYFSTVSTVPAWIAKSAHAMQKDIAGDKILVIVQLGGGNDGLNTIIPYTDEHYLGDTWRPTIGIKSGLDATMLDGLNAFHPKMVRLKDWWDNGNVAVIQNVGYPNPNLSHFVATDYWEFGTSPSSALNNTTAGKAGWAARFFDNQCAGMPVDQIYPLTMAATGNFAVPGTFRGSAVYTPPAIANPAFYTIPYPGLGAPGILGDYGAILRDYASALNNLPAVGSELDFIQRTYNLAVDSTADVAAAAALPPVDGSSPYPRGSLGDGLELASQIIRGGFGTGIFYVTQGGYDTHANQIGDGDPINAGDHQRLLDELDQCLGAFMTDMALTGNLDKVLVMTFSEFGRRVGENNSNGTDHGAGNCMLVMGGKVNPGVYGGQPALDPDSVNDNNGNVGHTVDFRAVYSRVIRDWFDADPEPVFGAADFAAFGLEEDIEKVPFIQEDTAPPPVGPEDVNNSGAVDAVDIQLTINAALGIDPGGAETDVNGDGDTNAVDIQQVINAALGGKSAVRMPAKAYRAARR